MSLRDTRSSPQPAARSRIGKAMICNSAEGPEVLSCRNSSPGAIRRRRGWERRTAPALLRQITLQSRPALVGLAQKAFGIGGKSVPALLAGKQIKPLTRNQPEPGVTGNGDAAGQVGRVVAAELRGIYLRMGDKRRPIALVAKTPDHPGLGGLEVVPADYGAGIDKIGDGVEPLDRDAGVTVRHHALGRGGPARQRKTGQHKKACQQRDSGYSGARACSEAEAACFLPPCRHSCCR